MKKPTMTVAVALALAGSMMFTSCIGNFTLTKHVLNWNEQIGGKFVNELVFLAFCILPVYECTAVVDLLVMNSIEFWSGRDPMSASVKVIDTDNGRYLVKCDGKGYDITGPDGNVTRLNFDVDNQTWALQTEEGEVPFMTFVDTDHVRMLTPDGSMMQVELSQAGLQAYRAATSGELMAAK